eukprot:FR734656.1.p2 GENE.FR734656.1~~FR734656.1.p2  ORF type:complete len:108 (+),score=11.83 FR734656.1:23-325(+)
MTSQHLIEAVSALGYDLYWDIHPLYHGGNYFGNVVDIFTDGLVAINMLGVPRDRVDKFSFQNFVKIRDAPGGFFLHEYTLYWKNSTAVIHQHGNDAECHR